MAHPGFGHMWQQAEMSDAEFMICVSSDRTSSVAAAHQVQHPRVLHQFPGHSFILSCSPYFTAQVLRWSTQSQTDKRQITITLSDESYAPAAMALLAGLYMVAPWPELLAELTPQQQLQAADLADRWELPLARDAAVKLLQEAACSTYELSALLEGLLSMEGMQDFLLPVYEQVLLSKYGDLEVVWAPGAAALQESLMKLPLSAMRMLPASEKLKVASEDTVLFTAQACADHKWPPVWGSVNCEDSDGVGRQQTLDALAPLVRSPHLSLFWLSTSVLTDHAERSVLWGLQASVKRLLCRKQACMGTAGLSVEAIKKAVPKAPDSWLLPVRDIQAVDSVNLVWQLDVAAIKQAAQNSASQQKTTFLFSPLCVLAGGIKWNMSVEFRWDAAKQGSSLGLFAMAADLPAGAFCPCTCSFNPRHGADVAHTVKFTNTYSKDQSGRGFRDFFQIGAMPGGFDEAAWAANGLPTSGSILLMMTVEDVGF